MAVTFTKQEIELGKAMGLSNVSSQSDKDQIKAFAQANGVSSVNSNNDLAKLLPLVKTPQETSPGSNQWTNPNDLVKGGSYSGAAPASKPASSSSIPSAASNGSVGSSGFDEMMMNLNQQLAAQQANFQAQVAAQQLAQQAQTDQMNKALEAALKPIESVKAPDSASGWKGTEEQAKKDIESLLLSSSVLTAAAGGGNTGTGGTKSSDLKSLVIA